LAKITFIGTGEAFDPGLPNTSILYEGKINLLLDCGYSVPHAFWRQSQDPSFLDGIYLTHIHADHSFGLPALLLWMRLNGRKAPLKVLGGPGLESWLSEILNLGYPGAYSADKCFPIEAVPITPGTPFEWAGVTMRNARSTHSVRNLSVRLESEGKALCYSGDGSPNEATRALFEGADMLVHECYSDLVEGPNHAAAEELISMSDEIQIQSLYLLHLGVAEKKAVAARAARWRGSSSVYIPKPGDTISL